MTPLVWRAKKPFLHNFYVKRPLFWLSTIAQEANKVLQRGVSLPFIGSLRVYVSRWKLQNFKYEHWDFTPSWRLRNNNFYLSVTEWLATPGSTKFLKPIEEMSKEELNVFLKRFCSSARKKDRTLSFYKRSSMKSFWEPPLIVSFTPAAAQQTIFLLSLTLLLLTQIKH